MILNCQRIIDGSTCAKISFLVDLLEKQSIITGMFFKSNKETATEDLKLSNFDSIWTKFCFLDETGNLSDPKDPFFTVGVLKMSQPYYLQSKIMYERNKRNFHDEIKFNKLSKNNIEFAKFIIGALFDTRSIDFYSYTTNKSCRYFQDHFHGDQWVAYEQITLKLLDAALSDNEILMLIADHVTTPKDIKFEVNTKKNFSSGKKRLALAGVCRFDSKSNDLLQVVDLIIGAVTYDLKLSNGVVTGSKYKIELVEFLKQNLGVASFSDGFRNRNFNLFVEKDNVDNEKGRSS